MTPGARGPAPAAGLLPAPLRWAGPLLACGYALGSALDRALKRPRRAPLPVICAGNLTAGGTGKTPAVKHIARRLAQHGHKPAVLMRGYKEQARDEAHETEAALSEFHIPVLLGADRWASACRAHERGCTVALLDDGFQHWRLARDLDIVLIDGTNPFGGGHLLPWGRLREQPAALRRAGVVIVTRADLLPAGELAALQDRLREHAPQAAIAAARHAPAALQRCGSPEVLPLDRLNALPVAAACGLGNPLGFRQTLAQLNAGVRVFRAFGDHHGYTAAELSALWSEARAAGAQAVVITEKDAPKIAPLLDSSAPPVWVLKVAFEVLHGEAEMWARIDAAAGTGNGLGLGI